MAELTVPFQAYDELYSKNQCVHLPITLQQANLYGADEYIVMDWRGLDFPAACAAGAIIETDEDVASLFLQLTWAFTSLADKLNVVNKDLHASNVWLRPAPFGGHFLLRFELKPLWDRLKTAPDDQEEETKAEQSDSGERDLASSMVVFLRTKFLLTIGDWGSYGVSSRLEAIPTPLRSKSTVVRSSSTSDSRHVTSSTARRTRANQANIYTLFNRYEFDIVWRGKLSPLLKQATPTMKAITKALNTSSGAFMFYQLCKKLKGDFEDGQYIRIFSEFSPEVEAKLSFDSLSMSCFEQLEHIEWVSCQAPTVVLPSSSSPPSVDNQSIPQPTKRRSLRLSTLSARKLDHSPQRSALDEPKKRGRPCKNVFPQTGAERFKRHYYAKKAKDRAQLTETNEALRSRAMEEHRKKEVPHADAPTIDTSICIPLDSSLVYVYPSQLIIDGVATQVGLGVFASQFISKETRITEYCGNWLQSPTGERVGPPDRDWHHTHHLPLGAASRDILDGIRFPRLGCGVASLINSCRGTTSSANVKFKTINEVEKKQAFAVALRDIEPGEELLADYTPVII